MCPVSSSPVEGNGTFEPPIDPPPVALGVTAEDEFPEGVDACNVAKRSGVGEEAIGRLHPTNKRISKIVEKSLDLLIIPFN